jgi:phosphatidylserine synthase
MLHASASRGRWIVTIGAILVVGSCFLQWWATGGDAGLPRKTATGFSSITGGVFPMFLAGVATLLLITLPFASEKPVAVDHPLSYLLLMTVMVACYALSVAVLAQKQLVPFPPQVGPGFYLAALGILVIARGVFEFFEERRRRLY